MCLDEKNIKFENVILKKFNICFSSEIRLSMSNAQRDTLHCFTN